MSNQITPNPSKPTKGVTPIHFPEFVHTFGNLPTSYKDSMTYYETLVWLCKYLEETVIPAVNTNNDAVLELQELYGELNAYVTTYFDNLDVQEEINNKLDEMVTSGSLSTLFNAFMETKTEELNEMINEQNEKIETLENNAIKTFNTFNGKVCYFSDSYGNIETCPINWVDELNNLLGTEAFLSSRYNGSGFLGRGGAPTWPSQLQSIINQTTQTARNEVKAIIIAGGFNDRGYNDTTLLNAMNSFNTLAKNNFPNATIYLAMIGWTCDVTTSDLSIPGGFIYNLQNVLPVYSKCGKFGWKFLTNCEWVMHNLAYYQADKVHPNEEGSRAIASAMYSAINGSCEVINNWVDLDTSTYSDNFSARAGSAPTCKTHNDIMNFTTTTAQTGALYAGTTPHNFNANDFIPIFKITNGFGVGDEYRPQLVQGKAKINDQTEKDVLYGFMNGYFGFQTLEAITNLTSVRIFKTTLLYDLSQM